MPDKTVLITRPKAQSEEIIFKLSELGFKVILFPTIEIIPLESNQLEKAVNNIGIYEWIVFTSTNSVNIFFESFLKKRNLEDIKNIKIASVGPKVSKSLKKISIETDLLPEKYTAENLADSFLKIDIAKKNILIPGSKISNETLQVRLKEQKANVDFIPIYDTVKPSDANITSALEDIYKFYPDYIVFMSPSSVNNFFEIIKENPDYKLSDKISFVCIGPTTKSALENILQDYKNIQVFQILMPDLHTIEGIVEIIKEDCL